MESQFPALHTSQSGPSIKAGEIASSTSMEGVGVPRTSLTPRNNARQLACQVVKRKTSFSAFHSFAYVASCNHIVCMLFQRITLNRVKMSLASILGIS